MTSSRRADEGISVRVLEEACDDARALDRELQAKVIDLVVELHRNPYRGDSLADAAAFPVLAGCRRIRFDRPGWTGKPRYRLIYRNEPHDGAPQDVTLLAIGRRENLIAYAKAAGRMGEHVRGRARRPRP